MQHGVRRKGLLGTPVCVQLDLQDVFFKGGDPLLQNTHTLHTQVLTGFSSDGTELCGQCIPVQYVRYAASRPVSLQRQGLS